MRYVLLCAVLLGALCLDADHLGFKRLVAGEPQAKGLALTAKDTIFFREQGGELRQVLHVSIAGNWEKRGILRVEAGGKRFEVDVEKAPLDEDRYVVGIEPVAADTPVTIDLTTPSGQTARTSINALPHRRWRVYAALKTHYDLGYTEPIDHMLDRTAGSMLDKVYGFCDAAAANSPDHRFIWTYPSWLVDQVRTRKDAKGKEKFDDCISHGLITWHALPITLHSYFCGIEDIARAMYPSKELEHRYQKRVGWAKQTDVPGHTRILPQILARSGVKLLQIGANNGVRGVVAPLLFWWEAPDGSRVLTQLTPGYGLRRTTMTAFSTRSRIVQTRSGLATVAAVRSNSTGSMTITRRHLTNCAAIAVGLGLSLVAATTAAGVWSDYRFAADALQEIDLASVTAWKLSIDGAPERSVKVPGGGWNSDQQEPPIPTMAGVKDHVIYSRQIHIPAAAAGQIVKLLFGGCNYGADVFVGDRKVTEHHAPMTPFEADLTPAVEPGKEYTLRVKAYHRRHLDGPVPGMTGGHAHQMEHYMPIVRSGDHIRGMGECAWATDGMRTFAAMAVRMRVNDWAHFAPWSWVNYWPNFLEGMSHQRHPWKQNNHADRSDGVDGWGSPDVMLIQRALHPYLVVDRGLAENDPRAHVKSGKGPEGRPCLPLRYRAGATVSRQVAMFNGSLLKRTLECQWEARWDAPTGELFRAGRSGLIEIEPGFHATCPVEFALPETIERPRLLHLVLESVADGVTVFRDDSAQFQILPAQAVYSSARFVGLDQKTQGDWRGKYGASGYEVVGSATSLPAGVQVDWSGAGTWVWAKPTDDIRAPAAQDAARVAACRFAGQLTLQVDLSDKQRRLSLYYVDWDRRRAKQTFTIWSEDGTQLDRREVEKAQDGCYLTWQVQGCVQITVEQEGGPNAVVSGIFLD